MQLRLPVRDTPNHPSYRRTATRCMQATSKPPTKLPEQLPKPHAHALKVHLPAGQPPQLQPNPAAAIVHQPRCCSCPAHAPPQSQTMSKIPMCELACVTNWAETATNVNLHDRYALQSATPTSNASTVAVHSKLQRIHDQLHCSYTLQQITCETGIQRASNTSHRPMVASKKHPPRSQKHPPTQHVACNHQRLATRVLLSMLS